MCQVANLVFWLGVHAGLTVVERHRHALDLFPDDGRQVPFGLGATVFFPTRDLKLANPHPVAVGLRIFVVDGVLRGQLTAAEPLPATWRVVEVAHRFERDADGSVWRINRLERIREGGRRIVSPRAAGRAPGPGDVRTALIVGLALAPTHPHGIGGLDRGGGPGPARGWGIRMTRTGCCTLRQRSAGHRPADRDGPQESQS